MRRLLYNTYIMGRPSPLGQGFIPGFIGALLFERLFRDAKEVLAQTQKEALRQNATLLLGNICQMAAELHIQLGEWEQAEKRLAEAEAIIKDPGRLSHLFIRKWRACITILKKGGVESGLKELSLVRREALKSKNGETIRDCDRLEAVVTKNRDLFLKVYFGTPFPSFRHRLLSDFGEVEIPPFYSWGDSHASLKVDVLKGEVTGAKKKGVQLNPGEPVHRLLCHLCSDFYNPFRVRVLYGWLFPGTPFHPKFSEGKVRETVQDLFEWIKTSKLPLLLQEEEGAFFLQFIGPISLLIPPPKEVQE